MPAQEHLLRIQIAPAFAADPGALAVYGWAPHGRPGLASAVLRAWWRPESARGAVLFYRVPAENRRVREVAKKLDLVPLGQLWTISG